MTITTVASAGIAASAAIGTGGRGGPAFFLQATATASVAASITAQARVRIRQRSTRPFTIVAIVSSVASSYLNVTIASLSTVVILTPLTCSAAIGDCAAWFMPSSAIV